MCGITGILDLQNGSPDPAALDRMTDVLTHRGPDGRGVWIKRPIALGHRRLAILDLSDAAAQPMHLGHLTVTYNGEVYNYQELRKELEKLGQRFFTRSDTEVILVAYAQWGPSCVERFNGMFALAIWDDQKQELFLARDRYGIKPLYYAFFEGLFLFGSEQKAILAHPAARREIDLEALLEYFTFQNIFTDRSLTKGIKLFPPGTHATISTNHQLRASSHHLRATSHQL